MVYCGSCGQWPLLSDQQRMEGTNNVSLRQVCSSFIVGAGAINTQSAIAVATHAHKIGAAGLMVIPRVLSRGTSPPAQRNHFKAILDAAPDVPAIIYTSPYSGYSTKADLFLARRAGHANLVGFKEFGSRKDLRYAAEHITSQNDNVIVMVGVDTEVYDGVVKSGASGTITGIGTGFPTRFCFGLPCRARPPRAIPRPIRARELAEAFSVLAGFDEGVDLVVSFKPMMVLNGEDEYRANLNETDELSPARAGYCEARYRRFRAGFANWSGQGGVIAECL